MSTSSWPTPLKKLRQRFPNEPLVQMRITFGKTSSAASISYDGVATDAIKQALLAVILVKSGSPEQRDSLLEVLRRETGHGTVVEAYEFDERALDRWYMKRALKNAVPDPVTKKRKGRR